eukprot:COSAG01_NODE_13704_length_1546_cov_1.243262_2_plen_224_part_00
MPVAVFFWWGIAAVVDTARRRTPPECRTAVAVPCSRSGSYMPRVVPRVRWKRPRRTGFAVRCTHPHARHSASISAPSAMAACTCAGCEGAHPCCTGSQGLLQLLLGASAVQQQQRRQRAARGEPPEPPQCVVVAGLVHPLMAHMAGASPAFRCFGVSAVAALADSCRLPSQTTMAADVTAKRARGRRGGRGARRGAPAHALRGASCADAGECTCQARVHSGRR